MTPFEAFSLGLTVGLAVAGAFVVFGYRLARLHGQQTGEHKVLSSRGGP